MVSGANAINIGAGPRRVIRSLARFVNPVVLLIAGRRWMPIVGILHHRGRKSGGEFEVPLGMRPVADGFVMPRTFGEHAAWYLNVRAAGWCTVTYRARTYTLVRPEVINYAAAATAFPLYERLPLRLLGINEFLHLRQAPAGCRPEGE
jgi:deazaflavin-dependent oxidoreductase (nitroreductase family)